MVLLSEQQLLPMKPLKAGNTQQIKTNISSSLWTFLIV